MDFIFGGSLQNQVGQLKNLTDVMNFTERPMRIWESLKAICVLYLIWPEFRKTMSMYLSIFMTTSLCKLFYLQWIEVNYIEN